MTSAVRPFSVVIAGHKTSVALEPPLWCHLKRIAAQRGLAIGALAGEIAGPVRPANLSSCIRLFVLADLEASLAGAASATGETPADRAAAALSSEPRRLPLYIERP